MIDADLEMGLRKFDIRKGRFYFRLTVPCSEGCCEVTSETAKRML
ncbi:hypothetical protein CLOSTASPAR_03499 [[Clostridium] asparagiforme DSM 15981]|uniref:Uncharacterized protein n=1 Tax=[Clostridium] asparagiforme DSM 15981 TaxID=518636 RepID=C0D2L0_9FIRM|nr:hypothetical protein CLOSTASPAR_03499 [[Clostridium] asparagiforme DSM 15981]